MDFFKNYKITSIILFCISVLVFDIICIISLKDSKDIYEICEKSNLPLYVTIYLIVPYLLFNKQKIIKTIYSTFSTNSELTSKFSQMNKKLSNLEIFLEWIFYVVLFFWGVSELEIRCQNKLTHLLIYWCFLFLIIKSGIITISQSILLCCGTTMSIVKKNNQETIDSDNLGYENYEINQEIIIPLMEKNTNSTDIIKIDDIV